MRGSPSIAATEWAARLVRVPERHRGPTFGRARAIALQWCFSGWADQALALGWHEAEIFGVRACRPFQNAPLRGPALTALPRGITDQAAYLEDGRVIRREQFGPDFIPVWCLDRRLRRPERHLVPLPNGLWMPADTSRAA